MLPIIATLAAEGLGLLANAVMAKGKDVIEKQLGVSIDTSLQSSEGRLKLKQLEFAHEEFLIEAAQKKAELDLEAERIAQVNVTDRWKADMLSDSWLSKNIRPLVLMYLLFTYTLFSIGSGFDFTVTESYVELLAQMLMLVMGAYFVGRTIEKMTDMKEKGKQ
jgi:hypothetical protein